MELVGSRSSYGFISKMKSLLASSGPSRDFQKTAVQEASKKGKKKFSIFTTLPQCPYYSRVQDITEAGDIGIPPGITKSKH